MKRRHDLHRRFTDAQLIAASIAYYNEELEAEGAVPQQPSAALSTVSRHKDGTASVQLANLNGPLRLVRIKLAVM
jgi:hypothetical protein